MKEANQYHDEYRLDVAFVHVINCIHKCPNPNRKYYNETYSDKTKGHAD